LFISDANASGFVRGIIFYNICASENTYAHIGLGGSRDKQVPNPCGMLT